MGALERRTQQGYIEINALGAKRVKIYVDGELGGDAPLRAYPVKVGPVKIKLVEQRDSGFGREEEIEVLVTERHTQTDVETYHSRLTDLI